MENWTLVCFIMMSSLMAAASANFKEDIETWGGDRAQILNNGEILTITLNNLSDSGFHSRKQYLYAKMDIQIKLIPGYSAGLVTAFYVSSIGKFHDEIDFEFLGRVEGDPYILQTNIFINGVGERENQFFLWFDPSTDFHNYTILWNPHHIVLYVDEIPIREFKNNKEKGGPFPLNQAMRIYGSLWNADSWATRGGKVKTDWTKAPFQSSFKQLTRDGCLWSNINGESNCSQTSNSWLSSSSLDYQSQGRMKWAQDNFMFYDYCNDTNRTFSQGFPPECKM